MPLLSRIGPASIIEILPMAPELHKENVWCIWSCGSFIDNFILLMNELPIQHRILIVNDFNFD